MELEDKYESKTTKEVSFPKAREVSDFQKIVKSVDGTLKYYIMVDGKWYFISNLTEV